MSHLYVSLRTTRICLGYEGTFGGVRRLSLLGSVRFTGCYLAIPGSEKHLIPSREDHEVSVGSESVFDLMESQKDVGVVPENPRQFN